MLHKLRIIEKEKYFVIKNNEAFDVSIIINMTYCNNERNKKYMKIFLYLDVFFLI